MKKKDSYWFRHDSTAGRGLKMRKMAHIYGHWGKGVYWDVIEILRDQEDYKFEKDESSLQMLADLIGCKDEKKFLNWYKNCVDFKLLKEEEKYFFSPALSESMEIWEIKKSNGSRGGRPKKTETKPKQKPKRNLNNNLNETITEQNITEQNKIDKFLSWFNSEKEKHTGIKGRFKTLSKTDKTNLFTLLKSYEPKEFAEAIPNLFKNAWAKETNNQCPAHFLRVDNFNKYLNTPNKEKVVKRYSNWDGTYDS